MTHEAQNLTFFVPPHRRIVYVLFMIQKLNTGYFGCIQTESYRGGDQLKKIRAQLLWGVGLGILLLLNHDRFGIHELRK
jgi:hypothetical protein